MKITQVVLLNYEVKYKWPPPHVIMSYVYRMRGEEGQSYINNTNSRAISSFPVEWDLPTPGPCDGIILAERKGGARVRVQVVF